ncbi:MAG: GNAT family N-acetyltransferase [Candidatus ainarchaeum sp.]|nr:GNAT family N-acetyltransferase [Candidatus ainarchaeum sp.]MDD5096758.1 GNAT family N-acetyltransferase [Candidatus ainarchaeum sp.]
MNVSLKKVDKSEVKLIFGWINEPLAREQSFHPKPISWEEHSTYWDSRLRDGRKHSFIISSGGEPVGLLRLDPVEGAYEVSILISEGHRGKGFATEALQAAVGLCKGLGIRKLVARVKPSNKASMKLFEACGFQPAYVLFERGA